MRRSLTALLCAGLALFALVACDDTFHYNKGGGHGGGDDSTVSGRFHPEGWAAPDAHGLGAKLHELRCPDCHGEQLDGEHNGVSCDNCHIEGWRTDCVYCHGGVEDQTGAPPEDIDDSTGAISFPPHHRHVTDNTHLAFGCEACHARPESVTTPGHLWDATPAQAEVDLSAGLSPQGSWDGAACSDLYCHGSGRRSDGRVSASDGPLGCDDCHAGPTSGRDAWDTMSGEHEDHLDEGLLCDDCHQDTTRDNRSIHEPSVHVNGVADFAPDTSYIRRTGDTCDGACHGFNHDDRDWH